MAYSLTQEGAKLRLELPGRLDGAALRRIDEEILGSMETAHAIEIDLSETTELSSFGIRILVLILRQLSCSGVDLSIAGVSPALEGMLDAVGIHLATTCPIEPTSPSSPRNSKRGALFLHRVDVYPSHHIDGHPLRQGSPIPFGARPIAGGINFSIQSAHATSCTLLVFDRESKEQIADLPFPDEFRIGNVFTMFVFGLDPDQIEYAYRFEGPFEPESGHRFDSRKVLIDPYARLISGRDSWGGSAHGGANYRSRIVPSDFDWDNDRPPGHAMEDLVIYEAHVRGLTADPSSNVRWPGTFAGLREKIPYLKSLGINCIELMPIFEFDELDNPRTDPTTGLPLKNYWGYNTVGFFAPKAGYAATGKFGLQADEFKALVKDLHSAGIEVLLDVVFNHTSEGDASGPTFCFRGIDNKTYYILGPQGEYLNYSGTGNTLNCNHPIVRDMVIDCLRYWVSHYHVDGFRFDLASILGRGRDGEVLANPPLLEALAHDPVLARCKLIAEAWDAAGLYQVGSFPSYGRWAEWNGRYRDTARRFLKGDVGQVGEFAQRLLGSPDLYADRGPSASVNYITCHDGFTLADLVSYDQKHNQANGEENRDGSDANDSWNSGVEGATDDPAINELRLRQRKNALTMLMVSQGVPMILMGDEFGRSQQGNNNAYCHDSPLNWVCWDLAEKEKEFHRFCRLILAFRRAHPALRHSLHSGNGSARTMPLEVTWHGVTPWRPDWSSDSRTLGMMLRLALGNGSADVLYVAFNMYWEGLTFLIPSPPIGTQWHLSVQTSKPSPDDIVEIGREKPLVDSRYIVLAPRSIVVLIAK
ncbi:glycogen debranching protein GlgX [bacterium]|nr:glycogen debranching protein GlgX [bacterium]